MIIIGDGPLDLAHVFDVAVHGDAVALSDAARTKLRASRQFIDALIQDPSKRVYGINTGFGSLKRHRIDSAQLQELQLNLVRSHAVGLGEPISVNLVRAMMLLRAHALSQGYSGVREEVVNQLVAFLNHGVHPVVPALGSVGASGDLAPLSHLALALMGEGDVFYQGQRKSSLDVMRLLGLTPLSLHAKEALAMINGTQFITAHAALALVYARRLLSAADRIGALSLDVSLGTPRAFDERAMRLKPHAGQSEVAQVLRRLLHTSELVASHPDCDRVQDAYSFRCMPQVHGAALDAWRASHAMVSIELNSVTDNPLVFASEQETISSGLFHGQSVALACDILAIALVPVMSMSERRQSRLLSHYHHDLPAALVEHPGLQSGLMMLQVTSAAIVSESKTLAHPASVDSIPTWEDQEDQVSMGAFAGRKALTLVHYLSKVLACEAVVASQALEFRRPLKTSPELEAFHAWVRSLVPRVTKDRSLSTELDALATALLNHEWDLPQGETS